MNEQPIRLFSIHSDSVHGQDINLYIYMSNRQKTGNYHNYSTTSNNRLQPTSTWIKALIKTIILPEVGVHELLFFHHLMEHTFYSKDEDEKEAYIGKSSGAI